MAAYETSVINDVARGPRALTATEATAVRDVCRAYGKGVLSWTIMPTHGFDGGYHGPRGAAVVFDSDTPVQTDPFNADMYRGVSMYAIRGSRNPKVGISEVTFTSPAAKAAIEGAVRESDYKNMPGADVMASVQWHADSLSFDVANKGHDVRAWTPSLGRFDGAKAGVFSVDEHQNWRKRTTYFILVDSGCDRLAEEMKDEIDAAAEKATPMSEFSPKTNKKMIFMAKASQRARDHIAHGIASALGVIIDEQNDVMGVRDEYEEFRKMGKANVTTVGNRFVMSRGKMIYYSDCAPTDEAAGGFLVRLCPDQGYALFADPATGGRGGWTNDATHNAMPTSVGRRIELTADLPEAYGRVSAIKDVDHASFIKERFAWQGSNSDAAQNYQMHPGTYDEFSSLSSAIRACGFSDPEAMQHLTPIYAVTSRGEPIIGRL